MNKIPCQYAIVRFSPFVETGEFANVGILLMAPKHNYFGYKLALNRYGRITRFFDDLEPKIYRETIKNLRAELKRAKAMLDTHGFDKRFQTSDATFAHGLFHEIVRPRETIIKFSETRTVLTNNPAEKLDELFSYYVHRSFVNKEYREAVLTRGIRRWLSNAKILDRFVKARVGDDTYHWNFPFVECEDHCPKKIIKPLFLGHDEPTKIIEHGGAWLTRVKQLEKRHMLPERVMFTIEGPETETGERMGACMEISDELRDVGVEVIPYNEKERVVDFALN